MLSISAEMKTTAGWIFEPGAIRNVLAELGFLPELTDHLENQAHRLAAEPSARREFLARATPWVRGESPTPSFPGKDFQALTAVAGLPQMMARHRERDLPSAITSATARDIQRRMLEVRKKSGQWEYTRLDWFSNHVHRDLLEIGRLQYQPAPCGLPYRIYVHRDGAQERYAFPEEGRRCSEQGWIETGATAFETIFEENEVEIVGNPVDFATGQIRRHPVHLPAGDFQLSLSPKSPAWHIHIPGGESFTPEACKASLTQATAIFKNHFPEIPGQAFCCTSWLLDRELWKCLPADSNIVAFAGLFLPLATPDATPRQLFERVFDNCEDWKSFQPRTRLQRSILQHLEEGGTFRETSGVILRLRTEQIDPAARTSL